MKLDIEDFSRLFQEEEQQAQSMEEVVARYEEKLSKLQQECMHHAQRAKEEGIEEGKKQAHRECQERIEELLQKCKQEALEEKKKAIEESFARFDAIERQIEERIKNYFVSVAQLLSRNLMDIFHYLFIDANNSPFIAQQIRTIIEELGEEVPLKIRAGRNLFAKIDKRFEGIEVQMDEGLEPNDFVVQYEEFVVESLIREKLKVLQDELRRALEDPA